MTRRLQAGDPAPDWTLPALNGRPVRLADYRGRTLVLVFARYFG